MRMRNTIPAQSLSGLNIAEEEPFGYMRRDAVNVIALGTLALGWLAGFILYSPVDKMMFSTWLPVVLVIWLGCILALALNGRSFRLAVIVLSGSLLVADGLALRAYHDGQFRWCWQSFSSDRSRGVGCSDPPSRCRSWSRCRQLR